MAADYGEQLRAILTHLGRPSVAEIAPPRMRKQADALSECFVERFKQEFSRRAEEGWNEKLNAGAQGSPSHPADGEIPSV
jgi:hypothetical protein